MQVARFAKSLKPQLIDLNITPSLLATVQHQQQQEQHQPQGNVTSTATTSNKQLSEEDQRAQLFTVAKHDTPKQPLFKQMAPTQPVTEDTTVTKDDNEATTAHEINSDSDEEVKSKVPPEADNQGDDDNEGMLDIN